MESWFLSGEFFIFSSTYIISQIHLSGNHLFLTRHRTRQNLSLSDIYYQLASSKGLPSLILGKALSSHSLIKPKATSFLFLTSLNRRGLEVKTQS
ncbi:MAG: hypothetical protein B5M54_08530 [Candidatus Aminicenantes bacterium 4484_214]|nr:MAG: hypothetical protein B5M54_08530 [Candidatus Aminicenantes bacterium 4484_214]